MSYQTTYTTTTGGRRLNEFVPTYVPHSDYLPTNKVVDGNTTEVNQWVRIFLWSWPTTKLRREQVTFTPPSLLISTPADTFRFGPMRTCRSIDPLPSRSSTAESGDTDPSFIKIYFLLSISFFLSLSFFSPPQSPPDILTLNDPQSIKHHQCYLNILPSFYYFPNKLPSFFFSLIQSSPVKPVRLQKVVVCLFLNNKKNIKKASWKITALRNRPEGKNRKKWWDTHLLKGRLTRQLGGVFKRG